MKNEGPKELPRKMHQNASYKIFQNAYGLRGNMTKAEELLWEALKGKKLGIRFRRQHPIQRFVADFFCHKAQLIIELDGKYHEKKIQVEADKERTAMIQESGIKIMRFKNEDIYNNIDKVVEQIKKHLEENLPKKA